MSLSIFHGPDQVPFELPKGWELLEHAFVSQELASGGPIKDLVARALDRPLDGSPLARALRPDQKVTIITDDGARNTPVRDILPVLFQRLEAAGIRAGDIDILVGLGTHGQMSDQALEAKYGPDIKARYRLTQHDCHAEDLVSIARLSSGAEVKVHPLVQSAEAVIGVGTILPHPMNGFGGGPKIVFPAVADYAAIREHHLAFTARSGSVFGRVEDNPFYDQVAAVVDRSNLTWSLDCVSDRNDKLAHVLFGSWRAVHERGGQLSRQMTGINFSARAELTLVAGYPYQEALQLMKPMAVAGLVTQPGGTLIVTAKSRTDFPPFFLEVFNQVRRESGGQLKKYAVDSFRSGKLLLENAPIDLNCALFYALVCLNDFRVVLVSQDLDPVQTAQIGFALYPDLAAALAAESARQPQAKVNLVPLGGALPILPQGIAHSF